MPSEAAEDGCRKLDGKAKGLREGSPIPAIRAFGTDELSLASGRTNVIHAALIQGGAALKFLAAASRLERYRKGSIAFATRNSSIRTRMSETNETEGKGARGGSKMTLNVRRTVEPGHVRQSFSHGRSKSVLVEKKKRRAIGAGEAPQAGRGACGPKTEAATTETVQKPIKAEETAQQRSKGGQVLRQLSDEEKDARTRALYDARQREADEQARRDRACRRRGGGPGHPGQGGNERRRSRPSARSRRTSAMRRRPRRARSARKPSASTS